MQPFYQYAAWMQDGGEADGGMAIQQMNAVMDKLQKLRQFINSDTDLEPWVSSKLAVMDHYADAVHDYMMYDGEDEEEEEAPMTEMEMEEMKNGGIPDRYRKQGFTKVGVKRKSTRPGKKWMVLAKKGDKYKIVHGGYKGMQDYTQHRNKKRQKNFWNRMGGKSSSKATDPFSPLYWHKRFGTWKEGGTPCFECGGQYQNGGHYNLEGEWVKSKGSGTFSGNAYYQDGGNLMPAMAGANQTVPMFQMGGSLPGAVGFTYARTVGAAPSNGPYAKKTKASAQNGQEMKFYQEGLDFTPKTINQDGRNITTDINDYNRWKDSVNNYIRGQKDLAKSRSAVKKNIDSFSLLKSSDIVGAFTNLIKGDEKGKRRVFPKYSEKAIPKKYWYSEGREEQQPMSVMTIGDDTYDTHKYIPGITESIDDTAGDYWKRENAAAPYLDIVALYHPPVRKNLQYVKPSKPVPKKPVQPVIVEKESKLEKPIPIPRETRNLGYSLPTPGAPSFPKLQEYNPDTPTKYSFTYPTGKYNEQKTMYFPTRSAWKSFTEGVRGASSQEGKNWGSSTGNYQDGGEADSSSSTNEYISNNLNTNQMNPLYHFIKRAQMGGEQQSQNEQIMQLIQAYAQMQGVDPQQIMAQLQQMTGPEQQQAVQQMMQAVQNQNQETTNFTNPMMAYGGEMGGPVMLPALPADVYGMPTYGGGGAAAYLNPYTDAMIEMQDGGKPEWLIRAQLKAQGYTGSALESKLDQMRQGGIHINPANKGKFTRKAKAAGMGVQAFASKVLGAPEGKYSPATRKQANFAKNASKWKKQLGGLAEGSVLNNVDQDTIDELTRLGYQFEIM